jgi:hypothetical protein
MLQALHQTGADGVVDCKHNDWNGARCPGGRDGGSDIRSQNDIDFLGDELANDAVILGIEHGLAKIDADVLAFGVAQLGHSPPKAFKPFGVGISCSHVAQDRHGLGEAR